MGRNPTPEEREVRAATRTAARELVTKVMKKAVCKKSKEEEFNNLMHKLSIVAITVGIAFLASGFAYSVYYPPHQYISLTHSVCTPIVTTKNWENITSKPSFNVTVTVAMMCKGLQIPPDMCQNPPEDVIVLPWVINRYIEFYPKACWEAIVSYLCQVTTTERDRQVSLNICRYLGVPHFLRYC